MSYQISPQADQDIQDLCDYIAQDNIDAALRLDARIHAAIQNLSRFPGIGHARTDVSGK